MEQHEAELFSKILDSLLRIVEKQVSPEDDYIKNVRRLEELRRLQKPTEIEAE